MGTALEIVPLFELKELFQFFLPGFIVLILLYNLTSYSKPSTLKKIVLAVVFTALVHLIGRTIAYILQHWGICIEMGKWDELSSLAFTIFLSVILAVVLVYFANNDKVHKFLRSRGITFETSFSSELFGSFLGKTWIVLHFHDERRLHGWLLEWPSKPGGHFIIEEPRWLNNDPFTPAHGLSQILIEAKDVRWIEFLEDKEKRQ